MKLNNIEAESLLSEPGGVLPGDKVDRPSTAVVVNEKFDSRKAAHQFSKQYAHSYAVRLWTMRPTLEQELKAEWPGVELKKIAELCEFSQAVTSGSNVNNGSTGTGGSKTKARNSEDHGQHIAFREDITVAIIGTIFKYQPEKPSILQELAEDNPMVPVAPKTNYTSDQDSLQLEDETTRVHLVPTPGCGITVGSVVNGIICAVKGKPNTNGKFEISEVIFPTPSPRPMLESKLEAEMVFVSGLELGRDKNSLLQLDILFDYLQGLAGCPSEIEEVLRKRTRIFFIGNTFASSSEKDKDSMKDQPSRSEIAKKLDEMFDQISQTMDVFILPGENDPSEPMLPQIPFHGCMFPRSSRRPTFKTLPNPVRLEVPMGSKGSSDKLDVLLSSGQNVIDAIRNSTITSPLEMAQTLLRWGHLCPTAPDTLALHPGVEEDVFVVDKLPHIFAVGNQTGFDAMDWRNCKIFTIPKFSETGMAVLLNTDFDIVPLKFQAL